MTNIDKRGQAWAIPKLSYQDIYPFEWPVTWRNEPSIQWGCHASRNWNAHRSAPQKVQWHGQSDAPIALVPLTKVAESASHFIVTSPHIPFLQTHIKIKDQSSQSAWTTKLLRKSFCVTVHDESGHKRNMGMQILQCECCESLPEWRKNAIWRPTATYSCLFQQETEHIYIALDKVTLWFIACCVSWAPWKIVTFSFSEKRRFEDSYVNITWKNATKQSQRTFEQNVPEVVTFGLVGREEF